MKFAPKPPNDFQDFYNLYYEECRKRAPKISAIAAKWKFEDLIPGLSDFDTRFIVEDGMTVPDWCDMSAAVGEAHLDICRRHPHWARNLEHLPGINLTWNELTDLDRYYPEYPQWTFYRTETPDRLAAAERMFREREWDVIDVCFHLKKFCLFYGRYDRKIDPPINLREFENKYPLHSRFMHYFCPPMQSALCILEKRPIAGKMESIRLACEMFADPIFSELRDAVERHYEIPELYEEPELTRLEDRLEAALITLKDRIALEICDIIPNAGGKTIDEWKVELNRAPISPSMRIFDSARFSRLMKGRLIFYATCPDHFDSIWPIENELLRLKKNFFDIPFGVYWAATTGEKIAEPINIVQELAPSVITEEEARCVKEFVRLTPGHWAPGSQKRIALEIAEVFDGFFSALNKIADEIHERERQGCI